VTRDSRGTPVSEDSRDSRVKCTVELVFSTIERLSCQETLEGLLCPEAQDTQEAPVSSDYRDSDSDYRDCCQEILVRRLHRKRTVELASGLGLVKTIRLKMSIAIQNGILNIQNSGIIFNDKSLDFESFEKKALVIITSRRCKTSSGSQSAKHCQS